MRKTRRGWTRCTVGDDEEEGLATRTTRTTTRRQRRADGAPPPSPAAAKVDTIEINGSVECPVSVPGTRSGWQSRNASGHFLFQRPWQWRGVKRAPRPRGNLLHSFLIGRPRSRHCRRSCRSCAITRSHRVPPRCRVPPARPTRRPNCSARRWARGRGDDGGRQSAATPEEQQRAVFPSFSRETLFIEGRNGQHQ